MLLDPAKYHIGKDINGEEVIFFHLTDGEWNDYTDNNSLFCDTYADIEDYLFRNGQMIYLGCSGSGDCIFHDGKWYNSLSIDSLKYYKKIRRLDLLNKIL